MKKIITLIGLAVLAGVINAQQFQASLETNVVVKVKPVVWRGTNATVIANQLLAVTNANGTLVVPPNFFSAKNSVIIVRVNVGTNGLQSIAARVH